MSALKKIMQKYFLYCIIKKWQKIIKNIYMQRETVLDEEKN